MVDYFYNKYGGPMDPYGSWQLESYRMGPSTNPKADQLKEFQLDANWGAKNIEIGFLSPRELENFPKPAADEVRRLAKLTGVKPSVHGPVEDPAGFDEFKKEQKEYARRAVVNRFSNAVDVAYKTGGAETPVVFHTSNYLPGEIYSMNDNREEVKEAAGVMDKETGRFMQLVEREKKFMRSGEEQPYTPEMQIDIINNTMWAENIRKLAEDRKNIEDVRGSKAREKTILGVPMYEAEDKLKWMDGATNSWLSHTNAYILNTYHDFAKYLPKAEDLKDSEDRANLKIIKNLGEEYIKYHNYADKEIKNEFKNALSAYEKKDEKEYSRSLERAKTLQIRDIDNWQHLFSSASSRGIIPKRYVSVEEYTLKPAAKTFAETALRAYNEYGDKAPHIMIENAPAPGAFSRPDKHKELVEEARNQLVELSKGKISRGKAEELIQATLDIGHFGLWKQYGYSNKDIVEMAKKIAPIAGHLHITDNFGSADAHLPPGWGNLPHGEVVDMLKKQGFKGRTIVEAGGVEAMGYMPYLPTLEYFNSGIYSWAAQPSWLQAGEYFFGSSGYAAPGVPLPYHHAQEYGAGSGFANLPPAGDVGKKEKSGMSGTPYS